MKWIKKGKEPKALTSYKKSKEASYGDLDKDVKHQIKEHLLTEQGYICAYCMQRISQDWNKDLDKEKMEIEHYIPQSKDESLSLEYKNMLGVCNGNANSSKKLMHCDKKKGATLLNKLNPLNQQQMAELAYLKDGTIYAEDEDLEEDLNSILNLNQQNLKENRKRIIDLVKEELKRKHGSHYKGLWKAREVKTLLEEWSLKENGKYRAYCEVAIYYLKQTLKKIQAQR